MEAILPSPAEGQRRFADAILDPAAAIPAGLACPPGTDRAERFAVYRNNVAVGLIEALRSTYPVVDRLVGREFFTAMARAHAFDRPPDSPVLLAYGANFPAFVAGFGPAAGLPYLADVARLEWAWQEAYHAADADPMPVAALESLPKKRLPGLRLILHPSARLLRFASPALTIWRLHQEAAEPAPIELDGRPEQALILRPGTSVGAIALSPGAFAFLDGLRQNRSVALSVADALAAEPGLDVAELLAHLFEAGAFAGRDEGTEPIDQGDGS